MISAGADTDEVTPARFELLVSARGNAYMGALAEQIRDALRACGREAAIHEDAIDVPRPGVVPIIIAPHEFFPLHPETNEHRHRELLAHAVCVNTEQPGNHWFELSAKACAAARLAIDINPIGRDAMGQRGIDARLLRLGYVPSLESPRAAAVERDIDVLFLGAVTPRRVELLASLGQLLWPYRSRILLFENDQPARPGAPGFVTGDEKLALFARTRFLLQINRSERGYFDSLRAVEAMSNGCVLVAESTEDSAPFVPWEHFAEFPPHHLRDYLAALLEDEPRRAVLAAAAAQLLRSELAPQRRLAELLPELDRIAATAPGRATSSPRRALAAMRAAHRAATGMTWQGKLGRGVARLRREVSAVVHRGESPSTVAHQLFESASEAAKDALLAEIDFRRQLQRMESKALYGAEDAPVIFRTPCFSAAEPEVSVVVPLYNYEGVVSDALASLAATVGVRFEAMVVDDRSTDGSRDRVLSFMEDRPDLPIELIGRSANTGLPAARNLGFRRARAPFVFVFDADNMVYPSALARLRQALVDSDAAFAYSIIEKFGAVSGLLSHLAWRPARLVRQNYIDAMAMVRRDAWAELGGYREDLDLFGWEDYDLWLRMAARGLRGVLVPEMLCLYRTQAASMIGVTNIETERLKRRFAKELPHLYGAAEEECAGV